MATVEGEFTQPRTSLLDDLCAYSSTLNDHLSDMNCTYRIDRVPPRRRRRSRRRRGRFTVGRGRRRRRLQGADWAGGGRGRGEQFGGLQLQRQAPVLLALPRQGALAQRQVLLHQRVRRSEIFNLALEVCDCRPSENFNKFSL